MKRLLKVEPAMVVSLAIALLGLLATLGLVTETVSGALEGVLVAGLPMLTVMAGAVVRSAVTPVEKVGEVVEAAARQVGIEVAAEITDGIAGGRGQISPHAQEIVSGAVRNVGGIVSGVGRVIGTQ